MLGTRGAKAYKFRGKKATGPVVSSSRVTGGCSVTNIHGTGLPNLRVLLLNFFTNVFVTLTNTTTSITSTSVAGPSTTQVMSTLIFPTKLTVIVYGNDRLFANGYLVIVSLLSRGVAFGTLVGGCLFICLNGLVNSLFISILFMCKRVPKLCSKLLTRGVMGATIAGISLDFSRIFFHNVLYGIVIYMTI